ncbi:MAG: hypothetical protein MI919_42590 [Holophagales bacterium]|nr:hypothetical protein [Holophagales bacterium]
MKLYLIHLAVMAALSAPLGATEQTTPGVGLACAGTCAGTSIGIADGTKKCSDLTQAEINALAEQACRETSKDDARSNANDSCDDGTGTCLCTGGKFAESGTTKVDVGGKCRVSCTLTYRGDCNTVAVPVEVVAALPESLSTKERAACRGRQASRAGVSAPTSISEHLD